MSSPVTVGQLKEWLAARPADNDPAWAHWSATELSQFWEQVTEHQLETADGLYIRYVTFEHPESIGWVIISPGRIETYLKYQELVLELATHGYSVAVIDHRGQGFSERMSHHSHHGHVAHFNEFVRDFADFMLALKPRIADQPCQLLAHSMGGAIACLYMANYPHPFTSAALSAPMMGVQTKPWPQAIAKTMIRLGHWLNRQLFSDKPRYFMGMKDYSDIAFADNELTHSEARYQWFRAIYQQRPEVQLGGPTVQWLMQSLQAMAELPEAANRIRIPLLILQASEDHIVSLSPQNTFVELSPHPATRLKRMSGSFHEILMETDSIRGPAMQEVTEFFSSQRNSKPLENDFSAPPRVKRSRL